MFYIFNFSFSIKHLYQADQSLLPAHRKRFNVSSNIFDTQMAQFLKYIFLSLAFIFNLAFCYCQSWTKYKRQNSDTTFAILCRASSPERDDAYSLSVSVPPNETGKQLSAYSIRNRFSVNFIYQSLQYFPRANFCKTCSAICNHCLHTLCPSYCAG